MYIFICMCVHVCVCSCVHVLICTCTRRAHLFVCACVHVCECSYVLTHTHAGWLRLYVYVGVCYMYTTHTHIHPRHTPMPCARTHNTHPHVHNTHAHTHTPHTNAVCTCAHVGAMYTHMVYTALASQHWCVCVMCTQHTHPHTHKVCAHKHTGAHPVCTQHWWVCYVYTTPCTPACVPAQRVYVRAGLFRRISSLLKGSFAKETYNFKKPLHHLILRAHTLSRHGVSGCLCAQCVRLYVRTHSPTPSHTLTLTNDLHTAQLCAHTSGYVCVLVCACVCVHV